MVCWASLLSNIRIPRCSLLGLVALAFFILASWQLLLTPAVAGRRTRRPSRSRERRFVNDPADLPKAGEPLSIRTPVQKPSPLKGRFARGRSRPSGIAGFPASTSIHPNGKHLATTAGTTASSASGTLRPACSNMLSSVTIRTFTGSRGRRTGTTWPRPAVSTPPPACWTQRPHAGSRAQRAQGVRQPRGLVSGRKQTSLQPGGTSGFITMWEVASVEATPDDRVLATRIFIASRSPRTGDRVATSAAKAGTYIAIRQHAEDDSLPSRRTRRRDGGGVLPDGKLPRGRQLEADNCL